MARVRKQLLQVLTDEKKQLVVELLLRGESPLYIAKSIGCIQSAVLSVLSCKGFADKCLEVFKSQSKGLALVALHNITRIAFSPDSTPATQLKASKILTDIARELDELSPDDLEPSTMTQSQIAERLKALQKEAASRARPVDTGQIDVPAKRVNAPSIDDMLD